MKYSEVLEYGAFSVGKAEKREILNKRLGELTPYHYENCLEYRKILDFLGFSLEMQFEDSPFLPVRLFKEFSLKSVGEDQIFKSMTSSGTTGQSVSKIYLDKETALNQQKTLIKIMESFIPENRMPMIILDSERVVKDRNFFSARRAGILGFSLFGRDKIYALDDDMRLDISKIESFLQKYQDKAIFAFGYTFIIWQYFYEEMKKHGKTLDFSNVILVHGGGWKKLINRNITDREFQTGLLEVAGLKKIHDFYGMVEQTGTIYVACEHGHMHASTYSEILIRRAEDFSLCGFGEKGLIQLISLIPQSYPGHNILTEDEGMILGEDDCPCGRKGKYFKILGRIKEAEIRGCSDTYESE